MIYYYYYYHGNQRVFKFEVTINVLVSSFRFIWIPMLWVYDSYKYFTHFRARTNFRRQKCVKQLILLFSPRCSCVSQPRTTIFQFSANSYIMGITPITRYISRPSTCRRGLSRSFWWDAYDLTVSNKATLKKCLYNISSKLLHCEKYHNLIDVI